MSHYKTENYKPAARKAAEMDVGIQAYVSPVNFGWTGELKTRYTDFQVNERTKDGVTLHLTDCAGDGKIPPRVDWSSKGQSDRNGHSGSVPATTSSKVMADPEPRADSEAIITPETTPDAASGSQENGEASNTKLEQNVPSTDTPLVSATISDDDRQILVTLLNEESTDRLLQLQSIVLTNSAAGKPLSAIAGISFRLMHVDDKSKRGPIHQEIRRIFNSRIESFTDSEGLMAAKPAYNARQPSSRSKQRSLKTREPNAGDRASHGKDGSNQKPGNWSRKPLPFIHFTLYKENKDTMDAINYMSRRLRVRPNSFGFAGTKDRRAVTVQRVSVQARVVPLQKLRALRLDNILLGDFKEAHGPIELGHHGGNEFTIVLKNCELDREVDCSFDRRLETMDAAVSCAVQQVGQHGFINYYGTQRFGTHVMGTHDIGKLILQGNYEKACHQILRVDGEYITDLLAHSDMHHRQLVQDETNRARAIGKFRARNASAESVLADMPRKYSAEVAIVTHLGRPGSDGDFLGAIRNINRGLRTLYLHSVQSYVWNWAATERWRKHGPKVIAGDLVLVDSGNNEGRDKSDPENNEQYYDENGGFFQRARVLSAEEAASGQYSIYDIVLPTPGFDVMYPANEIAAFYERFMAQHGLDPYDMARKQKDFSLSGNYRKLIGRFIDIPTSSVRAYTDDTEQMAPTDRDRIIAQKENAKATALKWTHFSHNALDLDKAATAEYRRRKASDPDGLPANVRMTETYIQRDGGEKGKRIKIQHGVDHPQSTSANPGEPQPTLGRTSSDETTTDQTWPEATAQETKAPEEPLPASTNGPVGLIYPKTGEPAEDVAHKRVVAPVGLAHNEQRWFKPMPSMNLELDSGSDHYHLPSANGEAEVLTQVAGDRKIAVILNFKLPSSSYATVALRELMGNSAIEK